MKDPTIRFALTHFWVVYNKKNVFPLKERAEARDNLKLYFLAGEGGVKL
jgi:hypothetical protein